MSCNVRLAIPSDEESIVAMLEARHLEERLGEFNTELVMRVVRRGIARDGGIIGVVRDEHGYAIGTIGLALEVLQPWDLLMPSGGIKSNLRARWNYVKPNHRKGTCAKDMIIFAREVASQMGCPLVLDQRHSAETDALMQLHSRMFPYKQSVMMFRFEPDMRPKTVQSTS